MKHAHPFQPKVIGLLGGSFNPAHAGHVHISREALKRLGCTQIVWLVSPQNPLKPTQGMADFSRRLTHAESITSQESGIVVSGIEQQLGTRYTVDTLRALKRRFPRTRFVWIMGADNLASIHKWENWQDIFTLCSVLVVDRSPFSQQSLRSKAALRFARFRISERNTKSMGTANTPCFGYVHIRLHPASSTKIREAHVTLK